MTIQSRPPTDDYRAGWDRVFGRKAKRVSEMFVVKKNVDGTPIYARRSDIKKGLHESL